jgi:hypothetical protein
MHYVDAHNLAHEFWQEPEHTPFPSEIQDKLIASNRYDYRHLGAMSVVYNGTLACDEAYIDAAEEILSTIDVHSPAIRTSDALVVTRDLSYLGLYRQIVRGQKPNYQGHANNAFNAVYDTNKAVRGLRSFNAGEASGILSEQLVVGFLNEAGFGATPSFPWQDQPFHRSKGFPNGKNNGYDVTVKTGNPTKNKVQVKANSKRPPHGISEVMSEQWHNLDIATRKDITKFIYQDDIALVYLDHDLGVPPRAQYKYFDQYRRNDFHREATWPTQCRDAVSEAIW